MSIKRISIAFISSIIITFGMFYLLIGNGYEQHDIETLQTDQSLTFLGLEYFRFEAQEGEKAVGVPNNFNMALVGVIMGIIIYFILEFINKFKIKK